MGSNSALHLADHSDWWQDPDYNPNLKARLTKAYVAIQKAPESVLGFREAGYEVLAYRDEPMCARQRMNVCYILAMAHAADDEHRQAVIWLDQALDIAHALGDRLAQIDLFFLRGFILQRIGRYDLALHDYREALTLLAKQRQERLPLDREQELIFLIGAAGFALKQEDYRLASHLLSVVRHGARHVPVSPLVVAWHDWFWALYLHARGKSERALQQALHAAEAFTQAAGGPHDVVLIHVFAARVALDMAATHDAGSIGRLAHLHMATLSLRKAQHALDSNDLSGKGYIMVRRAYHDALSGREVRALDRIHAAERLARKIGDDELLVQVLTVYGHILAQHQDSWDAALTRYRQALAISEPSAFSLDGLPARRAVRRLEEMHTESGPGQQTSSSTPHRAAGGPVAAAPPTSSQGANGSIRFSGAQVYALWPDGDRRWTVWTDEALSGPPVVRGNSVYVTTLKGTRYALRISDGAVLSRIDADIKRGKRRDRKVDTGDD